MTALRERRLVPLLLLDRLLQRIVPPRTGRVAWVSDPDFVGNAYHLFRHTVTTRPDLDHVWLVADGASRRRILDAVAAFGDAVADGARVRVVRRHSVRGYWERLRSRHLFHTHGVYPLDSAHRRDVVSLWHGMPVKCIGALNTVSPDPHPTFGTLHLATSSLFRYVIAAAFRAPVDRVLVTGLPRCDVLSRSHPLAPSPGAIRAALAVPDDDRLVLWLPTYRTPGHRRAAAPGQVGFHTFLDDVGPQQWRAVDEEAARHGCTVVVKLHPHDPLNEVDHDPGLDRVRLLRSSEWLATGIELYDLLAVADGLISDISSVLLDHLVTDRPLGMLGFDAERYARDVVFPVETLRDSTRIHDLDDPAALTEFFALAGNGAGVDPATDDLSAWLYDAPAGAGCETVLRAVSL